MKKFILAAFAALALVLAPAAVANAAPPAPAGSVATVQYNWFRSATPATVNVWGLQSTSSETQELHVKLSDGLNEDGTEKFIEYDITVLPGAHWTLSSPRSATAYVDVSVITEDGSETPVSRTLASKYDLAADGKTYVNITDKTDTIRNKTNEKFLTGYVYIVLP